MADLFPVPVYFKPKKQKLKSNYFIGLLQSLIPQLKAQGSYTMCKTPQLLCESLLLGPDQNNH